MRALLGLFLALCLIAAGLCFVLAIVTGIMLLCRSNNNSKKTGLKIAFSTAMSVAVITAMPPLFIGGCVNMHQRKELKISADEYVETELTAALSADEMILTCNNKQYYKLDLSEYYNAYGWIQEDKSPYAEIPDIQVRYNSASLTGYTHPKMVWKLNLEKAAFHDALLVDNTLYWEESIYEQAKQYYENPENSKLIIFYYSYEDGQPILEKKVDVTEYSKELEALFLSDVKNVSGIEDAPSAYQTFISAVVRKASLDDLYLYDGFFFNEPDSEHCCYWLFADGKWRGVNHYLPFFAVEDKKIVEFENKNGSNQIPLPAVEEFLKQNCPI